MNEIIIYCYILMIISEVRSNPKMFNFMILTEKGWEKTTYENFKNHPGQKKMRIKSSNHECDWLFFQENDKSFNEQF